VPTFVDGGVRDGGGHPIAGALLDVWQTDSAGLYDSQTATPADLHMRGVFRTNEDGRYLIRTVRPSIAAPLRARLAYLQSKNGFTVRTGLPGLRGPAVEQLTPKAGLGSGAEAC